MNDGLGNMAERTREESSKSAAVEKARCDGWSGDEET